MPAANISSPVAADLLIVLGMNGVSPVVPALRAGQRRGSARKGQHGTKCRGYRRKERRKEGPCGSGTATERRGYRRAEITGLPVVPALRAGQRLDGWRKEKVRADTIKLVAITLFFCLYAALTGRSEDATPLRIGHFPNITHAQALWARANPEQFEKDVGVKVEWTSFNAGPSAIEAMFSGAIDATFIGPNPAINGHLKSGGKVFAIVAGSASGGAALVVRADAGIAGDGDFNDKIIATPQLGNTQDGAARAWFKGKKYSLKEKGGTLTLLPLQNPDQLQMLKQKEIHGAWTIEPWVSRLVQEGSGKVYLEEKDLWPQGRYVTTHLIVSRKILQERPEVIRRLIAAHVGITQKLNGERVAVIPVLQAELKRETGKALSDAVMASAMKRVEFTWDPIQASLVKSAEAAHAAGFIKQTPDLAGIYDLTLLNGVLKEKNLPSVE